MMVADGDEPFCIGICLAVSAQVEEVEMRSWILRLLLALLVVTGCWVSRASARDFSSCSEVAAYLDKGIKLEPGHLRIDHLKKAVALVTRGPESSQEKCDDRLADRTLVTFAQTLEKYSGTFAQGSPQRMSWCSEAVKAYRAYLQWLFDLGEERLDLLVSNALKHDLNDAGFSQRKRRWLLENVGARVLRPMGNIWVAAAKYDSLLSEYESCFATYQRIEIFPFEAVEEWLKWLRTQPDYRIERTDSQVKKTIDECENCKNHWILFMSFTEAYLKANPEATSSQYRQKLANEHKRIGQWVAAD